MAIGTDRRYRFDRGRHVVWSALTDVDHYRRWWPWLRGFDGRAFVVGRTWQCEIRPPLGYPVRFSLVLTALEAGVMVEAQLDGDIHGPARVDLSGDDRACELRLRTDLASVSGPVRWVERLAPGLAERGHDQVLDAGFGRFRAAVLVRSP